MNKTAVQKGLVPAGASTNIKIAILGSMPSTASIAAGQYYAHPRNAFWRIAAQIFDFDPRLSYGLRCKALAKNNVGLWDVVASCKRKNSADSAIEKDDLVLNDIAAWLEGQPVCAIGLNGKVAGKHFLQHCGKAMANKIKEGSIKVLELPSTSPAYAAMGFAQKLEKWKALPEAARLSCR